MGAGAAIFAVLVVLFVAVSARLSRWYVTAPIAFAGVGALLGDRLVEVQGDRADLLLLAETTLVLLLFHDASQVRPRQLKSESRLELRLLLVGLPLTILAGWALARWMFPEIGVWLALLLAAMLAPTDAGLGAATVLNPVVPVRVRRILNAESGLNDGLATPVVLFAIAAVAGAEDLAPTASLADAALEIVIGVGLGVATGVAAGLLLGRARGAGWAEDELIPLGVFVLPLLAYAVAGLAHGNGFIAAFVAGTAFAAAARWLPEVPRSLALTETVATLLGFGVWVVFGATVAVEMVDGADWKTMVYAVAALTVLRMVPVWLSLLGTGLGVPTVAFIGWFGPRGLATVIFGLIAVEELDLDPELVTVLTAAGITVTLSVVLHGLTAEPLARRFGAWAARVHPPIEQESAPEPTAVRGRLAEISRVHLDRTADDGGEPR